MLIAGDIGDTKTDLAIYSKKSGLHAPLAEVKVHSCGTCRCGYSGKLGYAITFAVSAAGNGN